MTDSTLETLRTTKGKEYKLANDPPNYEMLMDSSYLTKLRYTSVLENQSPEQKETSDLIVKGLYGGFGLSN